MKKKLIKCKDIILNTISKIWHVFFPELTVHAVENKCNRMDCLCILHFQGFNNTIHDIYFPIDEHFVFVCEDIIWGNLSNEYFMWNNGKRYIRVGMITAYNGVVSSYQYLDKIKPKSLWNGYFQFTSELKYMINTRHFDKVFCEQWKEFHSLDYKEKEWKQKQLLDDINKDF